MPTPAARLRPHLPALLEHIAAGCIPAEHSADVAELLRSAVEAAAGRADAADRARRARTLALQARRTGVQDAVSRALAGVSMSYPLHVLTALAQRRIQTSPDRYGLQTVPSLRDLRSAVRTLRKSARLEPERRAACGLMASPHQEDAA